MGMKEIASIAPKCVEEWRRLCCVVCVVCYVVLWCGVLCCGVVWCAVLSYLCCLLFASSFPSFFFAFIFAALSLSFVLCPPKVWFGNHSAACSSDRSVNIWAWGGTICRHKNWREIFIARKKAGPRPRSRPRPRPGEISWSFDWSIRESYL